MKHLRDIHGIVHVNCDEDPCRETWCEWVYGDYWYNPDELLTTTRVLTCLMCLGNLRT